MSTLTEPRETAIAIRRPAEVLLHAERTGDPLVVRWVVRGHLAGPCVEPATYRPGDSAVPPLVAAVLGVSPAIVAVTVRPVVGDVPVLRLDVEAAEAPTWRMIAGTVQDALRAAAHRHRWWPDGPLGMAVPAGDPTAAAASSLPSGPCRSCPRSSSRTSRCAKPPDPPRAST